MAMVKKAAVEANLELGLTSPASERLSPGLATDGATL